MEQGSDVIHCLTGGHGNWIVLEVFLGEKKRKLLDTTGPNNYALWSLQKKYSFTMKQGAHFGQQIKGEQSYLAKSGSYMRMKREP